MSAPDNTPYLSRFFLKFIEIIAAGLATAVSGYLIAHLSGALSSPSPAPATAVIQVSPSANTASNLSAEPNTSSANTISNAPGQPIAPNANIPSSPAAQAIPPISGGANDQRLPSQQGVLCSFCAATPAQNREHYKAGDRNRRTRAEFIRLPRAGCAHESRGQTCGCCLAASRQRYAGARSCRTDRSSARCRCPDRTVGRRRTELAAGTGISCQAQSSRAGRNNLAADC